MKFYKGVSKLERFLVAVVTACLVLVVFIQVVNRTLIKAAIAWPEEAARYLMVWQVFLASVLAFRQGANCCIDVLMNRAHGKIKLVLACFTNAACLIFAAAVTVTALQVMQTQIAFHQTSTALGLNMAVVYAALPTWGFLFAAELVFMTIQIFRPGAFSEKSEKREALP